MRGYVHVKMCAGGPVLGCLKIVCNLIVCIMFDMHVLPRVFLTSINDPSAEHTSESHSHSKSVRKSYIHSDHKERTREGGIKPKFYSKILAPYNAHSSILFGWFLGIDVRQNKRHAHDNNELHTTASVSYIRYAHRQAKSYQNNHGIKTSAHTIVRSIYKGTLHNI